MAGTGKVLSQIAGGATLALAGVFLFIALTRLFEDDYPIRDIIFRFEAFGIESLWLMAIILFAIGYYFFNSD